MKPSFKLLLSVAVAAIFFLTYCKEDEATPEPPDTRTKTQLILASAWKLSVSTCNVPVDTDGKDGASTDLLSQMLPCAKDDMYLFKADSTTLENTNLKCKSNEPTAWKGSWIFKNVEKTLQWNGEDYELKELSGSKMVLKYTINLSATDYEITDTYTH